METMTAPNHLSVSIEALFVSAIQRTVSLKLLSEFLIAWKQNVEAADPRNKVVIGYQKPRSGAAD